MANTAAINEQIVTPQEIATNHVQSSADNLIGKPAQEVKKVFDKLPELAIQKHNALINELSGINGASSIGTTENSTVQAEIDDRYKKAEVYSKAQTNDEINNRIIVIGASDMQQAVYDKGGKKEDIFDYTEKAIATAATTATKDLEIAIKEHSKAPMHAKDCNHTRAGTTHMLQLLSPLPPISIRETAYITLRFKAKANYVEGDNFNISGKIFTGKPIGEETALPDKAFVTGDIVSATYHAPSGTVLFFKLGGGGGLPKSWQEIVTAPAREAITKDDAIVYQEFGDLLETPKLLYGPTISSCHEYRCHMSADGRYLLNYNDVYKIDLTNDTYTKLPALSPVPSHNNHGKSVAINNDGSIIAFFNATKEIVYYTRNSNDTYTYRGVIYTHPAMASSSFFMFTTSNALITEIASAPSGQFVSINFSNLNNIIVRSFGKINGQVVSDYSGSYIAVGQGYSDSGIINVMYSPDGGITPYVQLTGSTPTWQYGYPVDISPKGDYLLCPTFSSGDYIKFVKMTNFTLSETSYSYNKSNFDKAFFDPSGDYFIGKRGNDTVIYSTQTPPYLTGTPVNTFTNLQILSKSFFSAGGEIVAMSGSYPAASGLYRIKKKKYVAKLDSVYVQSALSKNDALKNGIGIALESKSQGENCKVNLLTQINNKLGSLV